jgi:hypothetical protein
LIENLHNTHKMNICISNNGVASIQINGNMDIDIDNNENNTDINPDMDINPDKVHSTKVSMYI